MIECIETSHILRVLRSNALSRAAVAMAALLFLRSNELGGLSPLPQLIDEVVVMERSLVPVFRWSNQHTIAMHLIFAPLAGVDSPVGPSVRAKSMKLSSCPLSLIHVTTRKFEATMAVHHVVFPVPNVDLVAVL